MEQILAELSDNLQRIRKDRQDNIKSLKENRIKIKNEIVQARLFINNHLDKLQESLMKELYVAEEKESNKLSCSISSIQKRENEITEWQTNLDKIKQHASDLQTFLAMKHIQQDVTKNEQFIESLLKEDTMNHMTLSFEKENTYENLPTALNKMGTIILDTKSSDATLTSRKIKQAQMMVPTTHVPVIDDLKLTLRQTVKTIGEDITGCALLPDGKIIFSCYTRKKIYIIKNDGLLDFKLQPGGRTSHIHYIEDSQRLAVTSGSDTSITIIDMKNRKTEKSINVGSLIYGIVHKDGKLFYNGCTSGLCVVSLDDDSITQLVNDTLSRHSSIIIWSDQLYYINEDDSVTCCDLSGTFKWRLELASFLKRARGITVDNHGRVYVAGFESHNVVVISPDGNKHRVLLSQKDNIFWPQTLFFDSKNNTILISNASYVAFLFDVSN